MPGNAGVPKAKRSLRELMRRSKRSKIEDSLANHSTGTPSVRGLSALAFVREPIREVEPAREGLSRVPIVPESSSRPAKGGGIKLDHRGNPALDVDAPFGDALQGEVLARDVK